MPSCAPSAWRKARRSPTSWLNSAIATAQKKVEQRNYEIRKNLLKYDDVVNDQRKAVFEQRQEFMESERPVGHHRRVPPPTP